MTTTADRNAPSAGSAAAKPAASLLTVPIFRDRRDRRRHNGSGYADGEAAGSAADPDASAGGSESTSGEAAGGAQTDAPAVPAPSPLPPIPKAWESAGKAEADAAGVDPASTAAPPDAAPAASEAEPAPDPEPDWPAVDQAPMVDDPADAPAAAPRPDPAPPPKRFRDLKQYWRWLRYGELPEVDALDPGLIAGNWPHSMLIRVPEDGLLDIVRVFAPNGAGADERTAASGHPFAGDRMSQVSTWVLELAREAAAQRQPSEARESFQLDAGSRTFAVQLLPCVRHDDPAAYVLLHVHEA